MAEDYSTDADVEEMPEASAQQTTDKTFWIPGDLLGGNCKKGDRYTVEAVADPDEDGDVQVKVVSESRAGGEEAKAREMDGELRAAFGEKEMM